MTTATALTPASTAALDALSGPLADALIAAALGLVALMATAVVLTRDTVRQAIVLSGYGMVLGLLFLILQAPDVAMSQIGVGTVLLPLLVVLALHATRRYRHTTTGAESGTGRAKSGRKGADGRGGGRTRR
ncbi:Na(+)/H(+) antiporter subunit B [Actinomadura luteofluorescens]|uniref:Na(+)/H(+) antiporter subunit B n=1 Tax=Actinomadura luteofluorescens TaxID=46163 RepID=UPI003493F86E